MRAVIDQLVVFILILINGAGNETYYIKPILVQLYTATYREPA